MGLSMKSMLNYSPRDSLLMIFTQVLIRLKIEYTYGFSR